MLLIKYVVGFVLYLHGFQVHYDPYINLILDEALLYYFNVMVGNIEQLVCNYIY